MARRKKPKHKPVVMVLAGSQAEFDRYARILGTTYDMRRVTRRQDVLGVPAEATYMTVGTWCERDENMDVLWALKDRRHKQRPTPHI